jgi:hypothetical protein
MKYAIIIILFFLLIPAILFLLFLSLSLPFNIIIKRKKRFLLIHKLKGRIVEYDKIIENRIYKID